jgi:transcription termination factor NusB
MTAEKAAFGLNITQTAVLLIGAIIFGIYLNELGHTVHEIQVQNKANGDAVNKTVLALLDGQREANERGNDTIVYFEKLIKGIQDSEDNITGNLSAHRVISNMTRDTIVDKLNVIINQTR